ncbi:MarR family winged helix-turn-helix transcriptional regulator [Promicromonospora sp. AC04]|uniref:MarR family winged helix-turn-helix transcriptional regulator n=1 Tax=Promicromonospora sp. AC04 TaxID=2135723 RepID=UPI001304AEF8|nr:MarR family transcriptional regulator [Promicromonospora sp. AC04]
MTAEKLDHDVRDEACEFGPDGTSPLHVLAQLSVMVHSQVAAVAERNGVTPMQARMLGVLVRGPRRMNELGQALGVEKAALTGLVDRAVARGLIAREAIPGDRRSTHVLATPAGAAASEAFYGQLDAVLGEMIAALPAEARETFTSWTEVIVGAWAGRLVEAEAG